MGIPWFFLLLLFTKDGTFNLHGIMTTWEFEFESAASTNDSVPKGMKVCSPTTTACNNERNNAIVPTALNTPGQDFLSSGSMTTTVSEKSATEIVPTLNKSINRTVPLLMTASAVIGNVSETQPTQGTAAPGTSVSGTQKGETTAPTTVSVVNALSEASHSPARHTPFHPMESTSSPDANLTGLTSSSSGRTETSTMIWTSEASPESTQNSSTSAGVCAVDESPAVGGVCMCNESYYAHVELSRTLVTLQCQPQKIEVLLRSCFLRTHHWTLSNNAFSGCSRISKIEEGHRVHSYLMEKMEGSCGLQLSTNNSHALYFLEVVLFQIHPGFAQTESTTLRVSCLYPLMVNVSHPYPVVSFPYSTIHVPGTGDTIVILGIFTDPQQSSPLENRPVPLGTPLYVVLRATSDDPNRFALVVNDVFASSSTSGMGVVKATYHLVKESCPVSNQLLGGLRANGKSLEVTLTSDTLYLHSRVTLCDKRAGGRCQPTCSQKSSPAKNQPWEIRGSKDLESGSVWIVFGPIRISESNASSNRSSTGVWITISLLMLLCWM